MPTQRNVPGHSERRATLRGKPTGGRMAAALASEAPVMRPFGREVLVHTPEAIDLSRAERSLPLLVNHDARDALPIGRVENVHLAQDRMLRGEIVFSTASDRAREVQALVEEGTVGDVSIQYSIDEWERGDGEDDINITRWTPLEVSIVSVPADGATGIGRSNAPQPEEHTVPDETKTTPELDTSGPQDIIATVKERARAGRVEGAADERARLLAIDELTATMRRSLPDLTADLDALAQAAKEDGSITAERHQSLALELIGGAGFPLAVASRDASPTPLDMPRAPSSAASREAPPTPRYPTVSQPGGHHRGFVQAGDDSRDRAARGMELSILERAGTVLTDEEREGNQFRGWSMLDLARECLELHGRSTRGMSSEQVARAAIAMGGMRALDPGTANYITSDFPAVTENVITKRIHDAYAASPVTWNRWASSTQVPDFKQFTIPRLSQVSDLPIVAENAAYTDLTQTDAKEAATLVKHGGLMSFSWEAIVNDDQRMFSRTAASMGESAARTVDTKVYTVLTTGTGVGPVQGPVMGDGNQLFDGTNHGNVAGNTLDLANVVTVRTLMARQTDDNSIALGIVMRYLIVPEELRDTADNLAGSEYLPWTEASPGAQRVNTIRSTFEVIPTIKLTDAADWYAASAMGGTVEVAFLNGNTSPAVFREEGWNADSLNWKIRHPSVAYPVDWRGLVWATDAT